MFFSCQRLKRMKSAFILFLVAIGSFCTDSFNLLLIGDSFDRFFVDEWCSDKPSTHHLYTEKNQSSLWPSFALEYGIIWGHQNLSMDRFRPPIFCRDNISNDSVATLFIYGSNLTHPYHMSRNERYDDTEFRVEQGLRDYFEMIGQKFQIRLKSFIVKFVNQTHFRIEFCSAPLNGMLDILQSMSHA